MILKNLCTRIYLKRPRRAFTLVEVLVAVAILAIVAVGLLAALGGASKVLLKADTRETARDLAEAQMEYVQNLSYKTADPAGVAVFYDKIPDLSTRYPGYDLEIQASRVDKGLGILADTGLQEIAVVVDQGSTQVFTLRGMKVNRE